MSVRVDSKVCKSLLVEITEYTLKTEVACFSETVIPICQATRCHIQRVVPDYRSAAVASV